MAIAKTTDETEWVCRIMPRGKEAEKARKSKQENERQQELTD